MKKHLTQRASRLTLNHILVLVLAVMVGGLVSINNQIATSGKELEQLEAQALALDEQNQQILAQQVSALSLTELSKKAAALGFVEPETVINLGIDLPLASLSENP